MTLAKMDDKQYEQFWNESLNHLEENLSLKEESGEYEDHGLGAVECNGIVSNHKSICYNGTAIISSPVPKNVNENDFLAIISDIILNDSDDIDKIAKDLISIPDDCEIKIEDQYVTRKKDKWYLEIEYNIF